MPDTSIACAESRGNTNPRRKTKKIRDLSLFTEHVFRQWVDGRWCGVLSPSEQAVLQAVAGRTIGWGKTTEIIPLRHLVAGIVNKAGELVYAGCGLSKRTLITVLSRLVEEGFLIRRAWRRTFRYGINTRVMGSDADPYLARRGAQRADRAERDAIARARRDNIRRAEAEWRRTGTQEALDAFMDLLGDDMVTIRTGRRGRAPGAQAATENTGESGKNGANAAPRNDEHKQNTPSLRSGGILPARRAASSTEPKGLPIPRSRGGRTAEQDDSTPEVPATWKNRVRRVRREVADDPVNRDVLDHARSAQLPEDEPAARPAAPPAPPEDMRELSSILRAQHAKAAQRQARAMAREDQRPEHLEKVWQAAMLRATGQLGTAWSGKARGQMRNWCRRTTLPDPTMRWGSVLNWVAERWGEAVTLAVPFMVHAKRETDDVGGFWEDKRADLLDSPPALSLFLAMAPKFVEAYATLFHGAGFRERDNARALANQERHEAAMRRRADIAQNGYDNMSRDHMRNDELDDLARRLAERGDEDMQDLLEARGKWSDLARQLRRDFGAGWRRQLEFAIARQRRAAAEDAMTPEERAELDAWAARHSIGTGWDEEA